MAKVRGGMSTVSALMTRRHEAAPLTTHEGSARRISVGGGGEAPV